MVQRKVHMKQIHTVTEDWSLKVYCGEVICLEMLCFTLFWLSCVVFGIGIELLIKLWWLFGLLWLFGFAVLDCVSSVFINSERRKFFHVRIVCPCTDETLIIGLFSSWQFLSVREYIICVRHCVSDVLLDFVLPCPTTCASRHGLS